MPLRKIADNENHCTVQPFRCWNLCLAFQLKKTELLCYVYMVTSGRCGHDGAVKIGNIVPRTEIEPTFSCTLSQCANHFTTQTPWGHHHAHAYLSRWLPEWEVSPNYYTHPPRIVSLLNGHLMLTYMQCIYITYTGYIQQSYSTSLVQDPGHSTTVMDCDENGEYCP